MQCYRPFALPKAMTFDLDDTFYDNWPYIKRAEESLTAFIAEHYPQAAHLTRLHWVGLKAEVLAQHPELRDDVGQTRLATLRLGLSNAGYSGAALEAGAQACFDHFYAVRSDFTVSEEVRDTLAYLAKRIPLLALTNGNVDCDKIGISQYFTHVYHANVSYRAKPHPDMFDAAIDALGYTKVTYSYFDASGTSLTVASGSEGNYLVKEQLSPAPQTEMFLNSPVTVRLQVAQGPSGSD